MCWNWKVYIIGTVYVVSYKVSYKTWMAKLKIEVAKFGRYRVAASREIRVKLVELGG